MSEDCQRVPSELIAYRSRAINLARRCERSVESSQRRRRRVRRGSGPGAMSLPAATDQLRLADESLGAGSACDRR